MSRRLLVLALVAVALHAAVFAANGAASLPGVAVDPAAAQSGALAEARSAAPSATEGTSPAPGESAIPSSTPAPSSTDRPAAVPAAQLRAALDRALARADIPGASVTILWRDGRSWTGTSGFSDLEERRAVTPDTEFAIASMSKTFTAALVLRLVEEGKLSLDDRVAPLLPGVSVARRVTVRMLLDHTSGIADFFFGPGVDRALLADRLSTWTAERALTYVGPPRYRPGQGWNYSNTNYLLLGLLAERVGGAPVADQLRSAFLEPLGLTGTYIQIAERPTGPTAHGYRVSDPDHPAPPRDVSDGTSVIPFTSVVSAAGAAGDIASTSGDLARWAVALYGGNVLRPETLAAALADTRATARFHPYVPYGFGVQVTTIGGHLAYGHSGRMLGFRGELRYLPGDGLAIAIMTNQSRVDVGRIVARLVAIALPLPPRPPLISRAR